MSHYVDQGFKSYTAAVDITAHTAVKLTAAGQITPAAAATDLTIGTVHKAVKAGWTTDVRLRSASGTLNIGLAAACNAGDPIASNASGKGVVGVAAAAGAVPTTNVIGFALEAGAVGQVVELLPATTRI